MDECCNYVFKNLSWGVQYSFTAVCKCHCRYGIIHSKYSQWTFIKNTDMAFRDISQLEKTYLACTGLWIQYPVMKDE